MSKRNSATRSGSRASRAAAQKSKKGSNSRQVSGFKNDGGIFSLIYEHDYEVDSSDGDGNCLFRSISTSITGTETNHLKIRGAIAAELSRAIPKARINQAEIEEAERREAKAKGVKSNSNLYQEESEIMGGRRTRKSKDDKPKLRPTKDNSASLISSTLPVPDYHFFVLGDFDDYCKRMNGNAIWGGHLELQAAANIFGVKIIVLQDRFPPIIVNPDAAVWPDAAPTLVMSVIYRGGCHYDAVLPTDERRDEFRHSNNQLKSHLTTINDRHGKVLVDIPVQLQLLEPIEQSWFLSPDGFIQSREAGDEAKKKRDAKNKSYSSSKWSFDSQDDDNGNGDCDGGDDGLGDNAIIDQDLEAKRLARLDNSNHLCDNGDMCQSGSGLADDSLSGKKSSSKSSIPTLQFVFWGADDGTRSKTAKSKSKSSSSSKAKLSKSLVNTIDVADGFGAFLDDPTNEQPKMDDDGDNDDDHDSPNIDQLLDQVTAQIANIELSSATQDQHVDSTPNETMTDGIESFDTSDQKVDGASSSSTHQIISDDDWSKLIPTLLFVFEPPKEKKTTARGAKAKLVPRRSSARLKERSK